MARAELAVVIVDGGQAPIGGPAPESVRTEGQASRSTAGATYSTPGSDEGFTKTVQSFSGSVGDFVQAVAQFTARADRTAEGTAQRTEGPAARARTGATGETAPKPPGSDREADGLKGAFKDLAGAFGVLGLLKAIQQTIRGFGDLFFATEAVTKAKIQEATITIRQVGERTIDGVSRPGIGSRGETPKLPTTSLSTRVGPQDAIGPVKPAGVGGAGPAEAVTATASIGRLAAGAALATAGVAALGFAAKKAGDALDAQARGLSQWSPALAQSTAQAEIRAMRAEMDRARAVGPGLARFQEDWSRMMEVFSSMGTSLIELLTEIIDLLRPFFKLAETFLEIIAAALEVLVDLVKIVGDVLTLQWDEVWGDVKEAGRDIQKWLKKIADNFGPEDPLQDDFAEQLLNSVGLSLEPNPPPRPPRGGGGFGGFGGGLGGAGGIGPGGIF